MICPNCSKEIEDSSVFCIYCGKKIESESNSEKPYEETINSSEISGGIGKVIKSILMWIMIITALIFLFIAFSEDYSSALRNSENFWYGQYITTAIFHTLCALFFLKMAQLLHR
jgi:uncharacterized membrane protein YvbJ